MAKNNKSGHTKANRKNPKGQNDIQNPNISKEMLKAVQILFSKYEHTKWLSSMKWYPLKHAQD